MPGARIWGHSPPAAEKVTVGVYNYCVAEVYGIIGNKLMDLAL